MTDQIEIVVTDASQLILVGRHSVGRHHRDVERIQDLASKSAEESRAADDVQRSPDVAPGLTERRYTSRSSGRRVIRLHDIIDHRPAEGLGDGHESSAS